MSGPMKGGYEEGTPLTVNLMKPVPGLRETSLQNALAVGARTAQTHSMGVEGYDLRNFRRSHRIEHARGKV